ncbi:MAG: hypothetical protein E7040_04235 [Lentisphaerae bacterium]|nr:hypothetical protein [Lentisphaerota bacterium]
MSMNRKIFLIVILFIVACVAGFFVWKIFFGENDQEIIQLRMNEVARMMGKSGDESFVVQAENAKKISDYFDDTCEMSLPKFHKQAKMTRKDIQKNIATARNWTTSLEIKFYEMEFHFQEDDPNRCKVLFTGMIKAKTKTGGSFEEGYDLEMKWVKKDGEWLIEAIGFSEILNK